MLLAKPLGDLHILRCDLFVDLERCGSRAHCETHGGIDFSPRNARLNALLDRRFLIGQGARQSNPLIEVAMVHTANLDLESEPLDITPRTSESRHAKNHDFPS